MNQAEPIALEAQPDGRARILSAARQLFTQLGFRAVSMQQIADVASVNKATLYHHFTDKEALFVEVLRHEFDHVHKQFNPDSPESGSLRQQMLNVVNQIFVDPSPDIGRLMADLRQNVSEDKRAALFAQSSPPWDSLTGMFDRAAAQGEIKPLDSAFLSRLLFVMAASQAGWSKFGGCHQPNDQIAHTLVDILLDGIRSDAASVPTPAVAATTSD
jgi:AcrR family transcriptional regulator